MRAMIDKYSHNFPKHVPGTLVVTGDFVALSGATGNVGCIMLHFLLGMDNVKRIYLLTRSGSHDPKRKIAESMREKQLDPSILADKSDRVVYLGVDFSKHDFGLKSREYEEVNSHITHIIHCAWNINFNHTFETYESMYIAGLRHLIDLALSSPQAKSPRLVFISSIAAAARYKGPFEEPTVGTAVGQCLVPEAPIDDPNITLPGHGYGMSKYVAERILVNAAGTGLRATISRVGVLSGTLDGGAWARQESAPLLFRTILMTGMCPDE
ncbi:male sterility protein-domain-containing protein, partial [Hysterangium stoloniferum]